MAVRSSTCLLAVALAFSAACGGSPQPRVRVTSASETARIETSQTVSRANVSVFGSGIGRAELALSIRGHALQIQLHVRGLEGFRFEYADRQVQIEVHQDGSVSETGRRGAGVGQALAPVDPLFMPLRSTSDGFEIDSSPDFQRTGPRACRFEWIDFYR